MNHTLDPIRRWSTSSFGSPADTSPMELAALGDHLAMCSAQSRPLLALRLAMQTVADFAAPRVVTILVLFAMISAAAATVL